MAKVVPVCSSSKGNSVFVGDSTSGVLVDAGCSFKALREGLALCGIPFEAVKAVLVTHEHIDHESTRTDNEKNVCSCVRIGRHCKKAVF